MSAQETLRPLFWKARALGLATFGVAVFLLYPGGVVGCTSPASTPTGGTSPDASVSASAAIGPSGGTLALPNGITLNVPPGALPQSTTIAAVTGFVPPALAGVPLGDLLVTVKFTPEGLLFSKPAQLNIPQNVWSHGAALDRSNVSIISVDDGDTDETLDNDEGDPQADDLELTDTSDSDLHATVWHFSTIAAINPGGCAQLSQVIVPTSVATKYSLGISRQILALFQAMDPAALKLIPSTANIIPEKNFNLLSPDSVAALLLTAPTVVNPMKITSTWRSLATQYVIKHSKNRRTTASVGSSRHAVGGAVDIWPTAFNGKASPELACKAALRTPCGGDIVCAGDNIFAGVGPGLDFNFSFDSFSPQCGDAVHWDHDDDANVDDAQLVADAITAFQTLWNNNNPCAKIDENEFGLAPVEMQTMSALSRTPSCGFAGIGPVLVPPGGMQGLGCPPPGDDGGALTMCCPGTNGGGPSCNVACPSGDGGTSTFKNPCRPIATVISDMEDGSASYVSDGCPGLWSLSTDGSGSVTAGQIGAVTPVSVTDDPPSTKAIHVSGSGQTSTPPNFAFAVLAASLNADEAHYGSMAGALDASAYTGVTFQMKLSAGAPGVEFQVTDVDTDPAGGKCSGAGATACDDNAFVMLSPSAGWTQVSVPFSNLTKQHGFGNKTALGASFPKSTIYELKWNVDIPVSGPTLAWDIWIDNVAFF